MVDIKNYIKKMYKEKQVYALWEPDQHINIGDIGFLKNKNFKPDDNLKNFEIELKTRKYVFKTGYTYKSEGVIQFNSDANVGIENPIITKKMGYGFKFNNTEAILVHTVNTTRTRITNMINVEKEILKLVESKDWNKEWRFANEVISCDYGVYLFSDKGECSININADGKIGTDNINLASLEIDNKIDYSSFTGTKKIIESPHTPFVNLMKYEKPFIGDGHVRMHYGLPIDLESTKHTTNSKEKIRKITINEFLDS